MVRSGKNEGVTVALMKMVVIRGVSYIYGMFYRFGLIDVPDKVKEKMKRKR